MDPGAGFSLARETKNAIKRLTFIAESIINNEHPLSATLAYSQHQLNEEWNVLLHNSTLVVSELCSDIVENEAGGRRVFWPCKREDKRHTLLWEVSEPSIGT